MSVVLLVALSAFQRYGTSKVGFIFSPIMLMWFVSNALIGAEAMFADLGHFNKRAIQLAFFVFVYPALVLTYAGEAAYLVKNPDQRLLVLDIGCYKNLLKNMEMGSK
ncbi:Potassium transporter 26 [Camellia lanceoleosa]|uniref:Potassium transporter 26 n=1 Tax=Camellia lanceoleosa TaxID=1840588 RepID=A0ACC0GBD5_9ERIC|nr:Potassium transporter 26 [Camellia lanceoleosa]